MSSSELKQILRDLINIAKPLCIAYELIHGREPTSGRVSNKGAGENPHLPTPKVENHPDSPSIFEAGVGSLEAPKTKKKEVQP